MEKTATVSADYLHAGTAYPQPGVIACAILARGRDAAGRAVVHIDTEEVWGAASVEGATRFALSPGALAERDYGGGAERAWGAEVEPPPLKL